MKDEQDYGSRYMVGIITPRDTSWSPASADDDPDGAKIEKLTARNLTIDEAEAVCESLCQMAIDRGYDGRWYAIVAPGYDERLVGLPIDEMATP